MLRIHKMDQDRIGVQLAKKCIDCNLPALYVARILGVSRMSLHSWFNGKPLRDKNHQKVKRLLSVIDSDKEAGKLPVMNLKQAETYLDSISNKITLDS